jgi:hypothetical protein
LTACRLQRPHSTARQEPDTFIFVATVNNVDTVAGDCVMECSAGVLGNESEEGLAPRIIGVTEQFCPKLL